ncbi:MAG: DUF3421 domain-containing protein [Caldilineaceae bacterium]
MNHKSVHSATISVLMVLIVLSFWLILSSNAAHAQATGYEWIDSVAIYPDDYDVFGNIWGLVQVGDHQLPDGNLYEVGVCRVNAWGDGYHVGKLMLGDWGCWVPWYGKEYMFDYGEYEILADTADLGYDWMAIEQLSNRQTARYGILAGNTYINGRRKLEYICAHFGPNGWDVGKYIDGTCYIPYAGSEWTYVGSNFAILVESNTPLQVVVPAQPKAAPRAAPPAVAPADPVTSNNQIITAIRTNRSGIANNYPTQADQLAQGLVAHLSDFRVAGLSPERMSSILNTDDAAMRMIAATNAIWGDWDVNLCQKYGWNLYGEDPAGKVRPFRQLIIRLIQGRQGTLSEAEQRALESYFTRSEDAATWRNNMDAIIGAINKSFFP